MRGAWFLSLGLLACKGSPRPAATDAAPPVMVDAAAPVLIDAAPPDAGPALTPEELTRRAGQASGLGGGAPAAVITEPLIVALATGQASLGSVLDERGGVIEVTVDAAGRPKATPRCGSAARDAAATYLGRAVDRQLGGAAPLACDNQFVAAAPAARDPRAALGRHAVCRSPGTDDGGAADGLVFVVAADGGLRLRVVIALTPGRACQELAVAAGRALARAHCP